MITYIKNIKLLPKEEGLIDAVFMLFKLISTHVVLYFMKSDSLAGISRPKKDLKKEAN